MLCVLALASSLALDHPVGDVDGDYDLRLRDLRALIRAVRDYRAGGAWNHRADTDGDGAITAADLVAITDQLTRALSTDPWPELLAAEQDILAERWAQARDRLEWLVQMRGSWPRTHGLLAVVYQALGTDGALMDAAIQAYCDFARAWRRAELGAIDEQEAIFDGYMMAWINRERKDRDIPLLLPNPAVAIAAYKHSLWMYNNQRLDHFEDDPATESPLDRVVLELGCSPSRISENVGMWKDPGGVDVEHTLADLHQAFMNSQHHRENILRTEVRDFGVAHSATTKEIWCTEDFIYLDHPGGVCPGHEPQ